VAQGQESRMKLLDLGLDLLLHVLYFIEALRDVLAFCSSTHVTLPALTLLYAWPRGNLTAKGRQAFTAALSASRLCMINLSGNRIGPSSGALIADALKAQKSKLTILR